MKKILELKNERSQLIADMEAILNKAQTEKRSKTEDETTAWTSKNERVEAIDAEIKMLERQEQLNRSIVDVTPSNKEEKEVAKRYNLAKAIAEVGRGGLSGLEAEMHQEAKRELGNNNAVGNLYIPSMLLKRENEETKTTGAAAGHIPTNVAGLDLVVPNPLYRELGATVYENLSAGKLDIPFSQGHTAGAVTEASGAALQSVPTDTKGTLTATRYQGWQKFTNEYLAESAVMPSVLADMVAAVDRAVGKALVTAAHGANIDSAHQAADDAVFPTYTDILSLIATLENEGFMNEAAVMSKELFYYLAATPKLTSVSTITVGEDESNVTTSMGNFIVDLIGKGKGSIAGIDAHATSLLAGGTGIYDFVYGDWRRSYVGFWGGIQLLVDPYSASDNGLTKITFGRLASVAANPYAFVSAQNYKIA